MADIELPHPPAAELPGEAILTGGRLTPRLARVGDTVRRPVGPHPPFVHAVLRHLERAGFTAAPRFLGIDDRGQEILSYLDGQVPDNLDPEWTDDQLAAAARLLHRFHDATVGSPLAGAAEVVCHGDISPVNTVFTAGRPAALIDFDMARPGPRICDVSYGLFLWLNLGGTGHRRRSNVAGCCSGATRTA
jgi:Ser/Thr protein kinase RdoA (MazF antagonist)